MTTSDDRHPALPPRPPRSPAVVRRVRRALVGVTAVVGLGLATTATVVLTTGANDTVAAPAAALVGAQAPAEVAAEVLPAGSGLLPAGPGGSADAVDLADAAGPAVIDTNGTPLPAVAAEGVRAAHDALGRGDVAALEQAYAPTAGSAAWPVVEAMLADPEVRDGLRGALTEPPATRPDLVHVYERDGYRVGVDDAGGVRFVRSP